MKATASAPGKCILFGEHFVVYGKPAVVMAIDKRAHVEVEERKDDIIRIKSNLGLSCELINDHFRPIKGGKRALRALEPIKISVLETFRWLGFKRGINVKVRSEIIPSAGLGSSAAIAVATVAAMLKLFNVEIDEKTLFELSYPSEKYVHVHPSGVDQMIAINGGVIKYVKSEGITRLRVKGNIPLIIGDTGIKRNTGALVSKVKKLKLQKPTLMKECMEKAEEISEEAVKAIEVRDLRTLGELMNKNQVLLEKIGVSHPKLDELINKAREAGALGAKLTGAGGGGCMIALCSPEKAQDVSTAIEALGGQTFIAEMDNRGVLIHAT